jgi:hypothetical protein
VFSGSATALCATVSIKNDTISLAATSLTASVANAAELVGREPRQPGTALVDLCAHEGLRDAGTVKDLERRPTRQRVDRLNLGSATSSLTAASKPLPQGEGKHRRATHGFAPVAPMCRGANLCLASVAVAATPMTLVRVLSLDSRFGLRIAIAPQRPR